MGNKMKIMYMLLTLSILSFIPTRSNAEVTNKYCPVTTNEFALEKFSLEYKGETIYFCCNSCKKDFLANPEKYMAVLDSMKVASAVESEPHEHDSSNAHGEVAQSVNESQQVMNETNHGDNEGGGHDEGAGYGEELEHDHETGHGESSSLLTFIGKFHPLVIHFPIALVLTALLFTGLSMFFKVEIFDTFSIYLIYFAALSAVAAATLGLIAGSDASYPSFLVSSFEWHRILGISTTIVTFITAYFGYRQLSQNKTGGIVIYRLFLLLNAVLVGITGHLGATLVYGIDYFNF